VKDAETIQVFLDDADVDFDAARKACDVIARQKLKEPLLLAWYDGVKRAGHPDVHECTDKPGWMTYAENRGGELTIDVNNGMYVLIYSETSPDGS